MHQALSWQFQQPCFPPLLLDRPFINGFVLAGANSQLAVWRLEQDDNEAGSR